MLQRAAPQPLAQSSGGVQAPPAADRVALAEPAGAGATVGSARLVIHAEEAPAERAGPWPLLRTRALAWVGRAQAHWTSQPSSLRVTDLQGRPLYSANALKEVVSLRLPAGTYHVTIIQGGLQRQYTVALGPDASFDLHLHPHAHPHGPEATAER